MKDLKTLLQDIANGSTIGRDDARRLLDVTDTDHIMSIARTANAIRKQCTHNHIDFCALINAKSGHCSEDCSFCAQSSHHNGDATVYDFIDIDAIVQKAKASEEYGSQRFCIVTSGGALTDSDFEKTLVAYRRIKEETSLEIDGSLGFLSEERILQLKNVGLSRYNHNIETSRRFYPHICTTHSFDDRLNTLRRVKAHGIEVCCGGIIGMGESKDDRIDMAYTLHDEGVHCIPINILNPRKGTPLERIERITPLEAITTIAVFRLINKTATVKIAGGREPGLKEYQQLSLEAGGNGFIIGGYLTTIGNDPAADISMARDAGYDI